MAFDYTGYGLHEGTPSESACYENVRSVSGNALAPHTSTPTCFSIPNILFLCTVTAR